MSLIFWFRDCSYKNKNVVGGKCSSLGELHRLSQKINFSIADGFAITTDFYDMFLEQNNITKIIEENLEKIDINNIEELEIESEKLRNFIIDGNFTDEQIKNCYISCSNSGVDYMEIGFRNFNKPELVKKYGPSFFCYEDYLNKIIGDIDGCKIAVMVTINAFDLNDFVPKSQSKIDMVRVLMAYHGSKNKSDDIS
jgi:hypothetical protein